MAERIQQRRAKGWRMPDGAVYVGRPTGWGNPFRVGATVGVEVHGWRDGVNWGCAMPISAQLAVDLYQAWVLARPEQVDEIRDELAGKDLVCWCPTDGPCHADVLLEIANRET